MGPSGIYDLQPSPKALLGPKTGGNRGLLFTDEYMGLILKLFIALRLLGIMAPPGPALERATFPLT